MPTKWHLNVLILEMYFVGMYILIGNYLKDI